MTQSTTISVPEIHCDHCKHSLEGAIGQVAGVRSVEVSVPDATIAVTFDESAVALEAIKNTIEEQGYAVAD